MGDHLDLPDGVQIKTIAHAIASSVSDEAIQMLNWITSLRSQ
jgi:hypothetical protein